MEKHGMKQAVSIVTAGMFSLVSGQARADGYRNPPPTAAGIGKAGVHSAFVDDASAISYNPANLALQTNASVVVAVTIYVKYPSDVLVDVHIAGWVILQLVRDGYVSKRGAMTKRAIGACVHREDVYGWVDNM